MTESKGQSARALVLVKLVHTVVWAFFAGCIVAIPVASWREEHHAALWLCGIVALEVIVLAFNRWTCPLTPIAARYTDERQANFDIYLPVWLARNNKIIFGALYVGSVFVAVARWARAG